MDNRRHVYLSFNRQRVEAIRAQGFEAYHAKSNRAKWLMIQAKVWIICTSKLEEFNRYLSFGVSIFNIFHGIPLKAIALENYNPDYWKGPEFKRLRNRRRQQKKYARYQFLCATSPLVQAVFCRSFDKQPDEMPIVGEPRNDYLIHNKANRDTLIQRYGSAFASATKVFVYMPTFRDYGEWDNQIDREALNRFLATHNSVMLIRAHPSDASLRGFGEGYSQLFDAIPSTGGWSDAYEELAGSDVLISDYSSLIFEYLLTDNPVILYMPDHQTYEQNRHLGMDFEQVKPCERISRFSSLLTTMLSCIEDRYDDTLYRRSKALIHSVDDDQSSRRVHDLIVAHLHR